jgi:dipeptidase E
MVTRPLSLPGRSDAVTVLLLSCLERFAPKLPLALPDLAGRRAVVIPTAAYGERTWDWLPGEIAPLAERAGPLTTFDLRGKDEAQTRAALAGADIVYVTGGNTYFLLEHAQRAGLAGAVAACLAAGGAYIGASAGAILACPRVDFIGDMDNPARGAPVGMAGLALVPFLLMPHLDHPYYGPKVAAALEALGGEGVIGLAEDQGLLWDGRCARVV